MNKFRFYLFFVLVVFGSCVASPVLELYDELGVRYAKDCNRNDWLGYYQVGEDQIHLRRHYSSSDSFNHVALHELCHWSRADHRLGPIDQYRDVPDSFEEVMCDLVAIVLADELNIERISNDSVADYFDMQLSNQRMRTGDWQLIFGEALRSVEYLLKRPYSEGKLKNYLAKVSQVNKNTITHLSRAAN